MNYCTKEGGDWNWSQNLSISNSGSLIDYIYNFFFFFTTMRIETVAVVSEDKM